MWTLQPAQRRKVPATQGGKRVVGPCNWAVGKVVAVPLQCRSPVWLSQPLVLSGGQVREQCSPLHLSPTTLPHPLFDRPRRPRDMLQERARGGVARGRRVGEIWRDLEMAE